MATTTKKAGTPAKATPKKRLTKSMTVWLTEDQQAQLDAEVARIQAATPAAKVTRSSYATHALLDKIAQDRAAAEIGRAHV